MYRIRQIADSITGEPVEYVELITEQGAVGFPNVESNDGPERAAFLAWVAEGNTPEVIEP
jgi:hypothetical protein